MSRLLSVMFALVVLGTGCGSLSRQYPEKHRYVLSAERPPAVESAAAIPAAPSLGAIRIERVRVSPLFERRGFVYRTSDLTYDHDFHYEFFAPPGVLVREAARAWFSTSTRFTVATDSALVPARWGLVAKVERLYGDFRRDKTAAAVIEVEFIVTDERTPTLAAVFRRTYTVERELPRRQPVPLIQAWNAGLTEILAALEADLIEELR